MKHSLLILAILALVPTKSYSDDRVLPAQADDIAKADANLGAAAKENSRKPESNPGRHLAKGKDKQDDSNKDSGKKPDDNFGAAVSSEAKKLKDADLATRKKFGQSIAAQRRQNQEHGKNGEAQSGNSSGSGGTGSSGHSGSGGPPSNPLSHVPPQGDSSGGGHGSTNPGSGHH